MKCSPLLIQTVFIIRIKTFLFQVLKEIVCVKFGSRFIKGIYYMVSVMLGQKLRLRGGLGTKTENLSMPTVTKIVGLASS